MKESNIQDNKIIIAVCKLGTLLPQSMDQLRSSPLPSAVGLQALKIIHQDVFLPGSLCFCIYRGLPATDIPGCLWFDVVALKGKPTFLNGISVLFIFPEPLLC